jgi:hypothetical protein
MPDGAVNYDQPADFLAGCTDTGDVTYACPSLFGTFGIATTDGVANHTKGFTAVAGTQDSFQRAIECGKGMAMVAWRVLTDDGFAEEMTKEWEEDMRRAA